MTMSLPGPKRGTCGHVMVSFDGHSKCARCHDKGVGEDDCFLKKGCAVCKGFTPEQVIQLSTPTYRECKNKENRVASRMRFPRDRALIRLQTWIFLESAVTKLYENA